MVQQTRMDFDSLMRDLTMIGFGALLMWTLTSLVGVVSGSFGIDGQAALRFLLAVLVLVFARRTYWEIREWHWRKLPPDDRYGFASPLWDDEPMTWDEAREILASVAEPPYDGR